MLDNIIVFIVLSATVVIWITVLALLADLLLFTPEYLAHRLARNRQ